MTTTPEPDDEARRDFVRGSFLYLAVQAAHQRNQTFAEGIGYYDPARRRMREDLYRQLRILEREYLAGGVSDDKHLDKIVQLADEMTEAHGEALHGARYRIGTAQKVLNLYLKYLWGAGWIGEPPHCPFDNQVISRLPKVPRESRNWTEVDDPASYECWVREARRVAGDRSLAAWELGVWKPQ